MAKAKKKPASGASAAGKNSKKKAKPARKASPKSQPDILLAEREDGTTDKISRYLAAENLVPERFRGSEKYLDIVSWNIRWFDAKDPDRVTAITEVLDSINADIFVLTEIAEDGALDEAARRLAESNAGFYSVHYGATGGQQRVVLMWDRDWVRAKMEPEELFTDIKDVVAENKRKARVFPRRPLWGYFEALSVDLQTEGFNFELVGVHLKSQMPPQGFKGDKPFGTNQRHQAAATLAKWLETPEDHFDEDVLIFGDWNAPTNREEWEPIRKLEGNDGDGVVFTDINPVEEPTHLARLNKSGEGGGSRLDLHLITKSADAASVPEEKGVVIRWELFDHLGVLDTPTRQALFKKLKEKFSDHLPVVSRFYFTDGQGDQED